MEKDVVDFIKDENRELKSDIKVMLGDAITGMSGKVRFEVDKIHMEIDHMEKTLAVHDKQQNGILKTHADSIDNLEDRAIKCQVHIEQSGKFWKNWKLILAGGILASYVLHNIFAELTVSQIIEFVKKLFI